MRQQGADAADPGGEDDATALSNDLGITGVGPRELRGGDTELREAVGATCLLDLEEVARLEPMDLAGDGDREVVDGELRDRANAVASGGEALPEVVDADPDRRDRTDPGDDDPWAFAGDDRYESPSFEATMSTA